MHSQFITSHVKPKHSNVIEFPKFNLVCHHCGVFGHIRLYYHKLNRVSSSHAYNKLRNQYERLKNQIRVLTMHMNRFVSKPRQVFTNHDQIGNHNAKARLRITPTPHEFIDKPKVIVMWVRKFDLKSLRTLKKFIGESFC